MTRAEYEAKVLSLKGTHDYNMLCFIRGEYIASLEAENAKLKEALEKAAKHLSHGSNCPDNELLIWCDNNPCVHKRDEEMWRCWLDWLMNNNQNKGDTNE